MAFGNFGYGDPKDPRYGPFKDYIEGSILGQPAIPDVRWSPKAGNWFTYAYNKDSHVDFGEPPAPDSPLERAIEPSKNWKYVYRKRLGLYTWADVFKKVVERFSGLRRLHPNAVWNIYDGSWHEMFSKRGGGTGNAHVELELKIAEIKDLIRRGVISDEVGQLRILELLREYT